jgi:hypothetical protein
MTTYTKFFALCAFLLLSLQGMSQITKTEVQLFITAHAPSSAQRVFITRKIEYNGNNDFAQKDNVFDPATTSMQPLENSLRIKDGTGMDHIVPYSAIKSISYSPETEKTYSAICILID